MESQLLKQLYKHTSKILADNNQKDYETFERADRIIIWIVGFAIGIFVLLMNKDIDGSIPIPVFEIIAVSLVTIIFGLIYRIFSFFAMMYMTKVYVSFSAHIEIFCNLTDIPSPREIKDSDSLHDIIAYLKYDFNYVSDTEYSNLSLEAQTELRKLNADLYKTLAESNDAEKQLDEYNSTISRYFGISIESIKKRGTENRVKKTGYLYRWLLKLSYLFFFLTLAVFVIGAVYILSQLLLKIDTPNLPL